jgi:hypothetical protein
MEDILAIVVVLAMVGVFWYILNKILTSRKEKKELEQKRLDEVRQRVDAATDRFYARRAEQAVKNTPPAPKPVVNEATSTRTYYAPSSTQSVNSYDSSSNLLSDIADIAMIANTIHHWNDNERRSEPEREERSVGVTKTESSWGFDSEDSRKSISSSMDTSSSWFSSSDDSSSSWSSSDSGPSSDW